METTDLTQYLDDLLYAQKCISQVVIAFKTGVITERERKSNEGIGLGSSLFDLERNIHRATSCLRMLNAYRNPEEHKEFLDKLRASEDPEEDYSGSICPPPSN